MSTTAAAASLVSWEGDAAWKNALGGAHSRWFVERRSRQWPNTAAGRLEGAFVLPEVRPSFRLAPEDRIFTIGSCFARNIENHLMAQGFGVVSQYIDIPGFQFRPPHSSVILNKFTTHSMLNELRWALDPACPFPEQALIEESDGQWVDLQVVGEVGAAPRETIAARRPYVTEVFERIRDCGVVVMTLGLVEAWFDRQLGLYLNRAPSYWTVKRQSGRFALHLLDYRANREALDEIHGLLRRYGRPDLRMVVTVSPVPLSETFTGGDVLVANTYSKSTLRAAAEDFARSHSDVDYFPSYESVVLSDRRVAYQEDLHHVTNVLVDLNVRSFLDHYVHGAPAADARLSASRNAAEQLARVQGDLLAENAQLRAERNELQARLAAVEARRDETRFARLTGLSPAGQPLGVEGRVLPSASRFQGYAEVGETQVDGSLLVSGWALDREDGGRVLTIAVFVDSQPQAYGSTGLARPDVAAALQLEAPAAGFALTVPEPAAGASAVVRVFALSAEGEARELEYNRTHYALRTR
jgi:GSCFA family